MKKNLLILLFFAFVLNARAGVLIEPYVGIAVNGEWEEGNESDSYSGNTIGARLAWQQLGLFAGLDYRKSSFTFKTNTKDVDLDETIYAAVVGYEFPIMLRVWGEYVIGGSGENGNDTEYTKPSGTILGIGYTGLPFVSLNFEMANYGYDKAQDKGFSKEDSDLEGSHYLLSVSLPWSF